MTPQSTDSNHGLNKGCYLEKKGFCQDYSQNRFWKLSGMFSEAVFTLEPWRKQYGKRQPILFCLINTECSWTLIIYIRWSNPQKRLADPKRIKICLSGPRALCNFSRSSAPATFAKFLTWKCGRWSPLCLRWGMRGWVVCPVWQGGGGGGWGMLSDPDKLIPLAPAPVRYQGKGGMFSRWWWSRIICTNKWETLRKSIFPSPK